MDIFENTTKTITQIRKEQKIDIATKQVSLQSTFLAIVLFVIIIATSFLIS